MYTEDGQREDRICVKGNFYIKKKTLKSIIISVGCIFMALVLLASSCSIVQQRERGINYTFGQVRGDVIPPGLVWHAPFVSHIKCYTIVPQEFEVDFKVNTDECAVTKDLQDIGMTVNVKYVFIENRIKEIAMKYGDSAITAAMRTKIQSAVKSVAAQYTIYEAVEKQQDISEKIAKLVMQNMGEYPIDITSVDVINLNWTPEFDKQIKDTANRTQQVKIAEQEANIAAANAMKKVKEAEANKQAAELDALAKVAKAKGDADAKKVEADGLAYYNSKVAQNYQVEIKLKELEIQKIRAERWNGVEVSNQSVYVPNTYDLKTK